MPIIGGAHARPQLAVSLWPAINGERKTQQYHRAMKNARSACEVSRSSSAARGPPSAAGNPPGETRWLGGDFLRFGVVLGPFLVPF